MSGSLFDFALYFFHNASELLARGSGPYFYLPKMESHLEARLWNDVFIYAQNTLGIKRGTTKATVLIETILATFELDEILYELRQHSSGLNCGRWDYIFSFIKKFANDPAAVLPDRSRVTMTTHFLRSYSKLVIKTCHRREVHAMGGVSAYIPNKRDAGGEPDQRWSKVRTDKEREDVGRARRNMGRASGTRGSSPRKYLTTTCRAQPDRPQTRGCRGHRGGPASVAQGGHHRGRPKTECRCQHRLFGILAERCWMRASFRLHGGRGHGRNEPRATLAVDPPEGVLKGRSRRRCKSMPQDHRGRDGKDALFGRRPAIPGGRYNEAAGLLLEMIRSRVLSNFLLYLLISGWSDASEWWENAGFSSQ